MTRYFEQLPPDVDMGSIAQAIREVVEELQQERMTYADIAKRVSIIRPTSDVAIKVFASRKDGKRYNKNNQALAGLYDYIRSDLHRLPRRARDKALQHWQTLVPKGIDEHNNAYPQKELEQSLGLLFHDWLHVSDYENHELAAKISGEFVMLRKSVKDSDVIVKSLLTISKTSGGRAMLQVRHSHMDRQGVERKSRGFLVRVVRNVYGIMQVERGEGLEVLSLKEPIQDEFVRMMGFLVSMNMDRKILSARTFIERNQGEWTKVPPRLRVEDARNSPFLSKRLPLLDQETSLTLPDHVLESDLY